MILKKNFLLLAIIVGVAGVGLGIYTMLMSIDHIVNP